MKLNKIILLFIFLLLGCEKETIEINTKKYQKYQNEIKTVVKKNKKKCLLNKKSLNFSKIIKKKK